MADLRVAHIKFCGLTRAVDAELAAELGGAFAGVIFAGGPRLITPERAREVFAPLAGTPLVKVGVFGPDPVVEIARIADSAGVDVVQLHGGSTPAIVRDLRAGFGGEVWTVVRLLPGESLPADIAETAAAVDALVMDAAVPGKLGGTGVALDWARITDDVRRLRAQLSSRVKLVLAGGLRAENVGRALRFVQPDVVDVSSGVESAPGIKDSLRMRGFARAVRSAMDEVPES